MRDPQRSFRAAGSTRSRSLRAAEAAMSLWSKVYYSLVDNRFDEAAKRLQVRHLPRCD